MEIKRFKLENNQLEGKKKDEIYINLKQNETI